MKVATIEVGRLFQVVRHERTEYLVGRAVAGSNLNHFGEVHARHNGVKDIFYRNTNLDLPKRLNELLRGNRDQLFVDVKNVCAK